MTPGRHDDADDRSFGRSTGAAGLRGLGLLAAAVVLAVGLLNASDAQEPGQAVTTAEPGTTAPAAPAAPASSTAPSSPTSDSLVPPASTPPAPRPRGEVRVLPANATRVAGAGTRTKDLLAGAGFNALAAADATAAAKERAGPTAVYFTPGYEAEAGEVAAELRLAPTTVAPLPSPPPVANVRDANVVVVIGPDRADPPGSSTPGSSTPGSTPASRASSTTRS